MEAQGFPLYDDLLRGYDEKAVDLWLDRRSNIAPDSTSKADMALAQWDEYERKRLGNDNSK